MREIKFRLWDTVLCAWYEQENIIISEGKVFNSYRNFEDYTPAIHCKLNQYTGLKDKNNREIYEGDIDKHSNCQVIYLLEEGGFCLARFNEKGRVSSRTRLNKGNTQYLEIVGNIYENPELVKGDK